MADEDCLSFPLVDDLSWCFGNKRTLYLDNVSDISQKEGSGGPRPLTTQSLCMGSILIL